MKKATLLTFFLLLAASLPLQAAFYKPSYEVYTVKTEHFYIHYPKEVAPAAQDLLEIVERVHARLTEKLKWKAWGRTHVVLIDQTDTANGLATVLPANYLLLFVTPPEADSSLDSYKNYLELLFTHEYTHILHIDQHHRVADPFHWVFGKIVAPNGLTPGWMREGMAAWEETVESGPGRGNFAYSDMLLRTSIYENRFPGIDEAAGSGIRWPGNETQYIFGVKFWQWLAEKYGEDRIQKYMEEYAGGLWLFSLNNKARRVYGKSFYKLWKEWKEELAAKYGDLKANLEAGGLTPFEMFLTREDQLGYPTPHPSGAGIAYVLKGNDDAHRIVVDQRDGKKPVLIKRSAVGQLTFSRDGGTLLAYSSLAGVEHYTSYADVYVYDSVKKTSTRLFEKGMTKKSMRATDPDFSPAEGGKKWIVMVRTWLATDNLYVFDRENKKGFTLTNAPKYTQFSNPRFSPDGNQIVVSRRDHEGHRDLVLYSRTGRKIRKITDDDANDQHPVFSPDGRFIYFDSDRSGIPNIYRYNLANGEMAQVTNVLSGVSEPRLDGEGKNLFVRYYTSKGWDLRQVPVSSLGHFTSTGDIDSKLSSSTNAPAATLIGSPDGKTFRNSASLQFRLSSPADPDGVPAAPADGRLQSSESMSSSTSYESQLQGNEPPKKEEMRLSGAKKYNAFPQVLIPRYLVPTFATLDDAFLLGFSTGRFDPLYRHSWNAFANYRSDAQFIGGGANYTYLRYNPSIYAGFIRYSINWGNIFGTGDDFFEERNQGYLGSTLAAGHHLLSLGYFYEARDNITAIPAGFALPTLDRYAGLRFNYAYARYKQFPDSISQENGPSFRLGFDWTNSILGSASVNEQQVVTGDLRYYFEMPWGDHHVFGLRTAAGWVWGDQEFAGTFRFGGPFGEGNLAGYSSRLFPFRGLPGVTFAADRVLLFSGEYRLPIASIDRGLGTLPIFLRKIHMSFFSDYGDSWVRNGKDGRSFFEDFFMSAGTELKGDFVIGYGLPVTARAGYAIIVLNRDQIAGLRDSLFRNDISNGTFYFQFGTSF